MHMKLQNDLHPSLKSMASDPYTFGQSCCGVIAKDQLVDPCPDDALELLGSSSLCLDHGVHGYHAICSRRISTPQTTFVPDSRRYDDGRFFLVLPKDVHFRDFELEYRNSDAMACFGAFGALTSGKPIKGGNANLET